VYGAAISLQNGAINTDDRGISGYAEGEGRSVGVYGESGIARPGKAGTWGSYGGYFRSVISGGDNFGIYAEAANGTNNWAGFFQGDINVMGSGYANYTWVFSDRRFKRDITPLKSVNEKIAKLNGYTYGYRTDEFNDRNFDNNKHIGFIAQELKEVFPELVTEKAGYYAVDYQGMVPVLLEAIKEQQAQMNAQQKQIDELKAGQTTAMRITPPSIPVSLSDNNSIVLNQNVPNPFAESTTITYNITSDFGKAQIIFSTDEGKVIKTVDITAKGPGSLTVFADDLSHGIYTYTLVVDGKTISSYKMIKE
jgi:hypothetical protein